MLHGRYITVHSQNSCAGRFRESLLIQLDPCNGDFCHLTILLERLDSPSVTLSQGLDELFFLSFHKYPVNKHTSATTWYMDIQRWHLTIKLQLHLGHDGEKTPRACFCSSAVLWRRCLNTLVFVSHVKENRASSILVYERFLALLSVLHHLPPSGRFVSCWRAKDTCHWGTLCRLKSIVPVLQCIAFSFCRFFLLGCFGFFFQNYFD